MRILLVNDYGGATGGAEIQMLKLRKLLRDRNHDARLFSSRAELIADSPILADYSCYGSTSRAQVISQTLNVSAYRALRRALEDFQPDVVHVRMFLWQLSPLILPLLKPYPCLYQTAVYKAICPAGTNLLPSGERCEFSPGRACLQQGCLTPQTWVSMMLQRSLLMRWQGSFDRIVALSKGMKKELTQAGIAPVSVVYNGVPERSARPPLQSPPTVGYAGRFTPEKGIETLFHAFQAVVSQIPEAKLKLAGKGPLLPALQILAKTLSIEKHIVWLGHISQAELEKEFDALWVQVVPSLWAEPFGNVTTEAMMRGTAVVASAVGAQPEILDDSAGKLVSPGNVNALTAALLPILQHRDMAEEMGRAGRVRALETFSDRRCVDNFLSLYQELASESSSNQLALSKALT